MVISNIRADGKPVGQLPDGEMAFHIDQIYKPNPCKEAAALHAVEIAQGRRRHHVSRTTCAPMRTARWSQAEARGPQGHAFVSLTRDTEGKPRHIRDRPHYTHPLVRRIPENDKRALAVCRLMTDRIEGLSENESRELIEELCDRIEAPSNVYSHTWRVATFSSGTTAAQATRARTFPTTRASPDEARDDRRHATAVGLTRKTLVADNNQGSASSSWVKSGTTELSCNRSAQGIMREPDVHLGVDARHAAGGFSLRMSSYTRARMAERSARAGRMPITAGVQPRRPLRSDDPWRHRGAGRLAVVTFVSSISFAEAHMGAVRP